MNKQKDFLHFIELYKSREALWNMNSPTYKRHDLKLRAYEYIAKECKMTTEDVKKKIKSIRTVYSREKAKIENSKRSGCEPVYQPSLFWYHKMAFLDSSLIRHKILENSNQCLMPIVKKRRSSQICESKVEEVRKPITKHIENVSRKDEKDEADIYAEAWACSYRKLTMEQKLYAKKACDEIFILGQLEQLSLNSVRIEKPSHTSQRTVYRRMPKLSVHDISNSGDESTCSQSYDLKDIKGSNGKLFSSFHDPLADPEFQ